MSLGWSKNRGIALGRVREGRMVEDKGAAVDRGKSMSTFAGSKKILEAGVQSETVMGQKYNQVLGLIPWPLLKIHYFPSLISGILHCWKQEMNRSLVSPQAEWQLLVVAVQSHCPADCSHLTWAFLFTAPWPTQKIGLMPLPLWIHSLSGAFNASPGGALKVKIS